MSLDLGAVIGRVILDTAGFDVKYARLVRQMGTLGNSATRSAGGVRKLDITLAGASGTATRSAASMDRQARSTLAAGAAADKAAAAKARETRTTTTNTAAQARAARVQAEMAAIRARVAGMTQRQAAAEYRLVAAQARLNEMQETGVATTRQLAAAQASLIAAQQRAAAAQVAASTRMIAAGKKMSHSITLPVVAGAAVAIHSAAEFEQATNVYVTAAGESQKNLEKVRDGIKSIAAETGTSIKNLTDAEYVLQKAGLRGNQGIEVLRASAKGAREENAELSDVVQAMTSIMSAYNIPASKSVQVMNALKTGAGQAKVSMEDYTRALSTALPVAAANHISVSELLGAYSQLTQAGNTAQYSTQLLSSTIRALAAPNRVASKQMQQLGLDTVDVQKKLGSRGLSGTLKLYVGAITNSMGKSGLVVQKAFNQQASAMQDVQVMLQKMPPQVKGLSKQYQDGKISFGDWRQAVKGLPSDQAALAKSFASVSDRTHAFNDLLKAGDPRAQTFVATLRRMTNGAIGMNTVLQLMGDNFSGVDARTKAVDHSLHNTSKEVEGWKSTANLAAVRADRFKQSLHILAIDAGNALLPFFTRLVDKLRGVVQWFSGLDSTQKKMLGWSLAILAALGPVLGIVGRLMTVGRGIGRFVTLVGGQLATLSGRAESSATRTERAAQRTATALAGIGLLMAGSYTANSGGKMTIGKGLGTFGLDVAGGALAGSVFGPVGSAIGGLAGTAKGLYDVLSNLGDGAKKGTSEVEKALGRQKAAAADLLTTLRQVGGAYDQQYRQSVVQKLSPTGALEVAQKAGLKPGALTDYVIGKTGSLGLANVRAQLENAFAAGKITYKQMDKTIKVLQDLNPAAAAAEKRLQAEAREMGVGRFKAEQLGVSLKKLTAITAGTGHTLETSTAAGKNNAAAIRANVAAAKTAAASQLLHGKSVADVSSKYRSQIAALQANLGKLGFTKSEVSKLIGTYSQMPRSVITELKRRGATNAEIQEYAKKFGLVPPSKSTLLKLDKDDADRKLREFLKQWGSGIGINVKLNPQLGGVIPSGGGIANGKNVKNPFTWASGTQGGTIPPNTSFTVGEAGWEGGVTDARGRARIFSNKQSRAMGFRTPIGYAKGTGGLTGNAARIVQNLASQGINGLSQLAGILGNLKIESGFNPRAVGPGGSTGIAQWLGGRLANLRRFASKRDLNPLGVKAQALFLAHELKAGGYLKQINRMKGASNIAGWLDANFERSSGEARGARMSAAAGFLGALKRANVGAAASGSSGAGGPITTRKVDGKTKYVYGGQIYASKAAAENARTRDVAAHSKDFAQNVRDANTARKTLGKTAGGYVRLGRDGKLRGDVSSSGDVHRDLYAMERAFQKLGVSSKFVDGLAKTNKRIVAIAHRRNVAAAHLKAANAAVVAAQSKLREDRSAFRGAVVGSYDVTSAGADDNGTVAKGRMRAQQVQAVTRARAWLAGIKKLAGSKMFPPAYLRDLAGKGPDALGQVQALLSMSSGELKDFAHDEWALRSLGSQVGSVAAERLDRGAIKSAQADQKTWAAREAKRQKQLDTSLATLSNRLVHELHGLNWEVKIKNGQLSLATKSDANKNRHRGAAK